MIDDLLDINVSFSESMVKMDKRSIRFNTGWVIFNLVFLIFDYYNGFHNGMVITQICIGAMWVNLFWSACFLWVSLFELKESKRRLSFYVQRKENKDVQESIAFHKSAAEHYENLCKIISDRNKSVSAGSVTVAAQHGNGGSCQGSSSATVGTSSGGVASASSNIGVELERSRRLNPSMPNCS